MNWNLVSDKEAPLYLYGQYLAKNHLMVFFYLDTKMEKVKKIQWIEQE